jgi:DNA-binding transcriptional MerR regulator
MSEGMGYFAKYVFEQLDITSPTLRRWSQTLENAGFQFERNGMNQRIYYDKDMAILRELKELVVAKGIPVETAANYVIKSQVERDQPLNDYAPNEQVPSVQAPPSELENKVDQMLEYIQRQDDRLDQQERFNQQLIAKLEEQHRYISESIERRDQQLMTAIREVQETKRLMAAAEEEKQEEPKKGFFARLFGK